MFLYLYISLSASPPINVQYLTQILNLLNLAITPFRDDIVGI